MDRLFKAINLNELLANPTAYLDDFTQAVIEDVSKRFGNEFILEGVMFADKVKKAKDSLNLKKPIDGLAEVVEETK